MIQINEKYPHKYIQKYLLNGNLVAGGVDDEEVAIAGDEQDRERGEEHARRLDRSDQLAENRLESWLPL